MDNTDILMKALMAIPEIPFNVRGVKKTLKMPILYRWNTDSSQELIQWPSACQL